MKAASSAALFLMTTTLVNSAVSTRERMPFNSNWRFAQGDPRKCGEALDYERIKAWVLPTGDDLLNYTPVERTRPSVRKIYRRTFGRKEAQKAQERMGFQITSYAFCAFLRLSFG
jgi:hypothetical protein